MTALTDEVRRAEMMLMEAQALAYVPMSDEDFERAHTEAAQRRRQEWSVAIDAYTAAMNTIHPVLSAMQSEIDVMRREAIYWRARARRAEAEDAD